MEKHNAHWNVLPEAQPKLKNLQKIILITILSMSLCNVFNYSIHLRE